MVPSCFGSRRMSFFTCFNDDEDLQSKRQHRKAEQELKKARKDYNATNRLLLLGAGESGKSTIVKQMVLLHVQGGFTKAQKQEKVMQIRRNMKDTIEAVTEAMSTLVPPVPLGDPANEDHLKYVRDQATRIDFEFTPEYFERVEVLWKDPGVQAAYERSNEYHLSDCVPYFMNPDKIREVAKSDYKPSNQDMLRCRVQTQTILETKFQWDGVDFHVFDVGGQRGERRKWIHCFNDVTAIIFVVATSSYNLTLLEDPSKNRLQEALDLFQQIWNNRWLKRTSVVLFLNKQDLLERKTLEGRFKLESYFPEFANYQLPFTCNDTEGKDSMDVYLRAKYFIRSLFVHIARFTPCEGKRLYSYFTTAVDTNNIERVFIACRKIITEENLRTAFLL